MKNNNLIKKILLPILMACLIVCGGLFVKSFSTQKANAESDFKIACVSATLENNLTLNYKVNKSILDSGYSNPSITFLFNGNETVISEYEITGDYLVFKFNNVEGKYIASNIQATLKATKDSSEANAGVFNYSVKDYCEDLLEDSNSNALLKTLVVDILNYGAACQKYNSFNTSNYANKDLTVNQKALATSSRSYTSVLDTTSAAAKDGNTAIAGAQMLLENAINMQIYVYAKNTDGLTLEFLDGATQVGSAVEVTTSLPTITNPNTNKTCYLVNFRGLNATQLSNTITINLKKNSETICSCLYSVESYASAKCNVEHSVGQQEAGVKNLEQLIDAVMKYGDSAKAYVLGGGSGASNQGGQSSGSTTKVSSVTLNTNTLYYGIGEVENGNVQLSATVLNEDATDKSLTWSSSDTSKVTVNENGLVTILNTATVYNVDITATAKDGSGKSDTCTIKINYYEFVKDQTLHMTSPTTDSTWTEIKDYYSSISDISKISKVYFLQAPTGDIGASDLRTGFATSPTPRIVKDSQGKVRYVVGKNTSGTSFTVKFYATNKIFGCNSYYAENENSYSISGLFEQINLTTADFTNFDTSKITDMRAMFKNASIQNLDLSAFDTSNVTNMASMFASAKGIKSVNVSSFNTSKVTDMTLMFGTCSNLTSLDISNFNTSNVTSMREMFDSCKKLTSLTLPSNINTSKVTNMSNMFANCQKLGEIDVSNFNTSSCISMANMFASCWALTELDVSNFNTSKVESMQGMFSGSSITSINVNSFTFESIKNAMEMFLDCDCLETIYCNNDWRTALASIDNDMFYGCELLNGYDEYHVGRDKAHCGNGGYFTETN